MSKQDKTVGNERSEEITRRATLTLAAAVATFGAAMGMRASPAWAQDRIEGKAEGKLRDESRVQGKESKAEGKLRGESKVQGKESKAEGKLRGESSVQGKESKAEGKLRGESRVQGKESKTEGKLLGESRVQGKAAEGRANGKLSTVSPTKPISPPAANLNPAVRR